MTCYSIEPRMRKNVNRCEFLSFATNFSNKYKKKLFDTALNALKTTSKNVVHKTGEFLRNKIADVVTNLYNNKIVKTKPDEEVIILSEKRD